MQLLITKTSVSEEILLTECEAKSDVDLAYIVHKRLQNLYYQNEHTTHITNMTRVYVRNNEKDTWTLVFQTTNPNPEEVVLREMQ